MQGYVKLARAFGKLKVAVSGAHGILGKIRAVLSGVSATFFVVVAVVGGQAAAFVLYIYDTQGNTETQT